MEIFKGFYIIDDNGIIDEHYFRKRNRSFHERMRIMRGCLNYWGVTNIVECGFIERRPYSINKRANTWHYVRMSLDTFKIMCKALEERGILKEL